MHISTNSNNMSINNMKLSTQMLAAVSFNEDQGSAETLTVSYFIGNCSQHANIAPAENTCQDQDREAHLAKLIGCIPLT